MKITKSSKLAFFVFFPFNLMLTYTSKLGERRVDYSFVEKREKS